jgi:hypothetical protein
VSNPTVTGDVCAADGWRVALAQTFVFTQIASIASVISMSMVFISLPWLALDLTGSAASAGLVVSISAIPGLILSPVMGSFIDKFGRRRIAIWVELLTMLTSVMIPIFAGLWEMSLVMLIIIALLRGVVSPAGPTSRKSLVPDVARVARLTLDRANSIHEAVFASGFAIGPALAAILIGFFGVINTFWVIGFFGLGFRARGAGHQGQRAARRGRPRREPAFLYLRGSGLQDSVPHPIRSDFDGRDSHPRADLSADRDGAFARALQQNREPGHARGDHLGDGFRLGVRRAIFRTDSPLPQFREHLENRHFGCAARDAANVDAARPMGHGAVRPGARRRLGPADAAFEHRDSNQDSGQ